jgi:hypothetical protein
MTRCLKVLCVQVNFAVGIAVARRLLGLAAVTHCSDVDLARGEWEHEAYDVIVLCPYVTGELDDELIKRLAGFAAVPPAVVEMRETSSGHIVQILNADARTHSLADPIVAALAASKPLARA